MWLKMLAVVSSMNSTMISTKFCRPPGTPAVARLAARRKTARKIKPRPMDQAIESTWMDMKPISAAASAEWAKPQLPSGCWP